MTKEGKVMNMTDIDVVAYNPVSQKAILVIIETQPWNGNEQRIFDLQDKINAYMEFIVDGHLKRKYPNIKNDHVSIQIDCCFEPDQKTIDFLKVVKIQIESYKVNFSVNIKYVGDFNLKADDSQEN